MQFSKIYIRSIKIISPFHMFFENNMIFLQVSQECEGVSALLKSPSMRWKLRGSFSQERPL